MLDVNRYERGVLIRVLGWAIVKRIGEGEGRGGATGERGDGSISSHSRTLLLGVDVMITAG